MTVPLTKMALDKRALTTFAAILIYLVLSCAVCSAVQSDIDCLKSIKDSFEDPLNFLNTTWKFDNQTEGFICKFAGIQCWHPDETRVLSISLPDMRLKGKFPRGLKNCTSITSLDLSSNELHGSIPNDISKIIGFVVMLDLSSNNFSGEIPVNLANCSFLNSLRLDDNQFTGPIPAEIGLLGRLKNFNVANNRLTGAVPRFTNATFPAEIYANNAGLCGPPLTLCEDIAKKPRTGIIVGAAVGGVTLGAVLLTIGMFLYMRKISRKRKNADDPEGNKWAKSIKGSKAIQVRIKNCVITETSVRALLIGHKSILVGCVYGFYCGIAIIFRTINSCFHISI